MSGSFSLTSRVTLPAAAVLMVARGRAPTLLPFTCTPTVRIALLERSTRYAPTDCQNALRCWRLTWTRVATSWTYSSGLYCARSAGTVRTTSCGPDGGGGGCSACREQPAPAATRHTRSARGLVTTSAERTGHNSSGWPGDERTIRRSPRRARLEFAYPPSYGPRPRDGMTGMGVENDLLQRKAVGWNFVVAALLEQRGRVAGGGRVAPGGAARRRADRVGGRARGGGGDRRPSVVRPGARRPDVVGARCHPDRSRARGAPAALLDLPASERRAGRGPVSMGLSGLRDPGWPRAAPHPAPGPHLVPCRAQHRAPRCLRRPGDRS